MDEPVSFLERLENPSTRRLWLLSEALRCVPLDQAVELARAADAFIAATPHFETSDASRKPKNVSGSREPAALAMNDHRTAGPSPVSNHAGFAITAEQREQLLDRLANGASNAELAQAFSVTARQVQGIRMGAAREIAKRRERVRPVDGMSEMAASPEDVARYLRQQDDVVVPEGNGVYLVNGRFRLQLAELVSRANRMRTRQSKPAFRLANGHASRAVDKHDATRHPIFWGESTPRQAITGA
jgi:hypothetical protein